MPSSASPPAIDAALQQQHWPTIAGLLGLIALGLAGRGPIERPGSWPWPITGLALGAIGLLAWLSRSFAGEEWGLSITGPSRSLIESTILRTPGAVGWGTALVVGIPLGTWLSARARGPVRWRLPRRSEERARPPLRRWRADGCWRDAGGGLQHRQRIDGPLGAGSEQPDRHRRDAYRRRRRHHLAGNTRPLPRVATGEEGTMTKQWLDRLVWFSSLAVLGGILFLLLAAHADVQRWTFPVPSLVERLDALGSGVLPATAGHPATPPSSDSGPTAPNCDAMTSDWVHSTSARMTC